MTTKSGQFREGFIYQAQQDVYLCPQGKLLRNHGIRMEKGYANYYYMAKPSDCNHCPIKESCCGKKDRQRLSITTYRNHYQRMQQRLESPQGRWMKKRRQATVEPVFGSLLNYFGMRRSNARGIAAAHKKMLMAAVAYNLQKLLTFLGYPQATAQRRPCHSPNTPIVFFFLLIVVPHSRPFFYIAFA